MFKKLKRLNGEMLETVGWECVPGALGFGVPPGG